MTKVKFCGLTRPEDISYSNELMPDYVGFVMWDKSRRSVSSDAAKVLKDKLSPAIRAVGVFVDEDVRVVASLLNDGVIDIAQLHGGEDEGYIKELRSLTYNQIIKAFRIRSSNDVINANASSADLILLDAGMGGGVSFDWGLIKDVKRPYILAGGLDCTNVEDAIVTLSPFGVDVSSGIETDHVKDHEKMRGFIDKVRKIKQ